MISSSDLPACPACGSREVHPVVQTHGPTLYACRQCGRDQTAAWESVQPAPEPKPVIGPPDDVPRGTPHKSLEVDPVGLGIGATL